MSAGAALPYIFFAPARVFDSFRDIVGFGPAAIRFLIAAPIIVIAFVAYQAFYIAYIGPANMGRATMAATPQFGRFTEEQKQRALEMQQNPSFQVVTYGVRFGMIIGSFTASFFLGALIYWLGGMLFKGSIKYMQALLVWTYATLPASLIWVIVNSFALLIHPPTSNVGIATGADTGVVHANLGALFDVTSFPIPVYVVALAALDLFAFYGLALAMLGLRRVGRVPWIGSFVVVIFVWLLGVGWRVVTAGVFGALMK